MSRKTTLLCAFAIMTSVGVGCGGNNNDPSNVVTPNNSGSNNSENSNNSNNSSNNNGTTGTNNHTIEPNNSEEGCEELEIESFEDEAVDIEREFDASAGVQIVSCREQVGEIATDGAYTIRLQYSEPTTVDIDIRGISSGGGFPPRPAVELRRGACADGESAFCDTMTEGTLELDADVPYFLFVNGLLSSGGFSLQVTPMTTTCTPGEKMCAGDSVATCIADGSELVETACPADCQDAACVGDACPSPITVSPVANGDAVVIEGNRGALTSTWDAMNGDGCNPEEEGTITTPGVEFFILFEGVTAGQTLVLDADDSEDTVVFLVLEECNATTCLDAFFFDENSRNRASYTAPADGDVLFAVEASGAPSPSDFVIEASVRE